MEQPRALGDHLCPLCGGYGISSREKLLVRLLGEVVTCRTCGGRLTVDYWRSVVSLVPLLVALAVGFLVDNAVGLLVCLALGLAASWWYSIRYVPLVPLARSARRKLPEKP